LANLISLRVDNNQFSGSIPAQLGGLAQLWHLYMDRNQLTGSIPAELGNASNLRALHFESNNLSGPIPAQLGTLVNLIELRLNSNKLAGEIPGSIANLINLGANYQTDFGYNALYTTDEVLIAFLNSKDPDWAATQTIAPTQVTATSLDNAEIMVSWLPVTYTADAGYYQVRISENPGGPYTLAGQTADKTTSAVNVTGLTPGTRYYFVVRTVTNAHANNLNVVESAYSTEATAIAWLQTQVQISGTVLVGGASSGVVMSGLPDGTVTDALGAYSATVDVDFSGTVTPVLTGYTFDPLSRTYTNLTTNQTAQDYTATLLSYTVSGTVTLEAAGLAGVTMAGLPGNPVTDGTGFYQATVSHGTSFTVTPTHADYTFVPASRTYTVVTGNHINQDYAATPIVIPTITVTSPNGGERWSVGSSHDITWTQTGLTGAVTIDLYKGGVYQKTWALPTRRRGLLCSSGTARYLEDIRSCLAGGQSDDSDAPRPVPQSGGLTTTGKKHLWRCARGRLSGLIGLADNQTSGRRCSQGKPTAANDAC
jgi:hypothetical protein